MSDTLIFLFPGVRHADEVSDKACLKHISDIFWRTKLVPVRNASETVADSLDFAESIA